MKLRTLYPVLITTVGAAALAACELDSTGTGTMTLGVTDAPVDSAHNVYVQFSGVSLKPASGEAIEFTFAEPKQIDLLALQGGKSDALLSGESVPSGQYNWIRLDVDVANGESYIVTDTGPHALSIPSGEETGLKLIRGFTVPVNGAADFTIDFDLRKSVHQTGVGQYVLKPALRLVDNAQVGSIAGSVSSTTLASCSDGGEGAAVYVYEGADAQLGDAGSGDAPVTSALLTQNEQNETVYKAAFLVAGDYTVAFTCDAASDDPARLETLSFSDPQNVTVQAGDAAAASF